MPQLEGRVFSRLGQYEALPSDLKDEVSALVDYLTTNQNDVFGFHHANILKTVRSVRAKPLTEKITAWILHREAPVEEAKPETAETEETKSTETEETKPTETEDAKQSETEETKPAETTEETKPAEATETPDEAAPAVTEDEAAKAKEADAKAKEEAKEAAAKAKEETKQAALKAKEEAAAKAKADHEAHEKRVAHAKKLLEALVLRGFVTLYKEPAATPNTPESFVFGDRDLFIPIAKEVAAEPAVASAPAASVVSEVSVVSVSTTLTEAAPTDASNSTTVWDLVDGAIFAATLKRKAGFLAPLTQGKDVYVIVNGTRKTVTLFESDLGRVPIVEFGYEGTTASFDKSHFVHGVKIWNETITELVNASTKLEREALVHSLLAIGITYHEDLAPGIEKIEKIYELKDTLIDGQEIVFDKYKGKVLLIVNVSSKCGLTPTNYPELVTLHDKYREQGFEVLAFPCNQFMGQEPGTHEEIKEFVAQYNPSFEFFSKGDVNGVDTRPVFSFLKHKLPGPYIQWNFAKFLVDRNGVPVQRFGPRDLPLSFESEIVKLIAEEVKPEVVETPETAAAEATEPAVAVVAATETVVAALEASEGFVPVEAAAPIETPAPVVEAPAPVVEAPAPVEAPVVVEETKAPAPVEPTTKVAAPPEVAPPAEVVKSEAEAPKPVETPVETKVEAATTPQPEVAVEQPKTEEAVVPPVVEPTKTDAAPVVESNQAPIEESTPAESAVTESIPKAAVPAQGFTEGNEPATIA